jgi:hypothetical protein
LSTSIETTALRVEDGHAWTGGSAAVARLALRAAATNAAATLTGLATAATSPATPPCRLSTSIETTALRVEDGHAWTGGSAAVARLALRALADAKIDYCTDYDLGEAYENLLNKNVLYIIE